MISSTQKSDDQWDHDEEHGTTLEAIDHTDDQETTDEFAVTSCQSESSESESSMDEGDIDPEA